MVALLETVVVVWTAGGGGSTVGRLGGWESEAEGGGCEEEEEGVEGVGEMHCLGFVVRFGWVPMVGTKVVLI